MKFVKGVVIGTAVTMAALALYEEGMLNKKKIMKGCRRITNKIFN